MKKFPLLLCLFLFVGCYSIKKNKWLESKFVPLEKTEVVKNMKDYTLEIPTNWYSFMGYHFLHHSPKKITLKGKREVPNVNVYTVIKSNISNRTDFFESEINSNKVKGNTDLHHRILKHDTYGDVLFLKYGSLINNENYTVLEMFYFYKNKVYNLTFKAPNNLYVNYVDDALKIMNSIQIKA